MNNNDFDKDESGGTRLQKDYWFYFWRWKLEEWRLLFTGFQALGGVTLASLAIYGVFFTAIPETIVRQLRADVADAKEELSGVRAERNRQLLQLDKLNSEYHEALTRGKEAEAKLDAANTALSATSRSLVEAQTTLSDERSRISSLRAELEGLQTAGAEAREKLKQVEADIARLSADREGYLRVARSRDFLFARIELNREIQKYKKALEAALNYIDAPGWDAQEAAFKKRTEGKSASEARRMYDEEQTRRSKELPEGEAARWAMLEIARWTRFEKPLPYGTRSLQAIAGGLLERDVDLPAKSGRTLILERFTTAGSLTPPDFAAFRATLEAAMRRQPLLNQSLLVQRSLVEQRGEVATRELDRTASAIKALDEFLESFHMQIQPARR
jgi:hypothetical protein